MPIYPIQPTSRFFWHSLAFLGALFIFLGIVSPALAQEGVRLTAEVDRTAISSDDSLTLTVTVAGDYEQLGEPQLPFMSGFEIVGSSQSNEFRMVNGVVTARAVFVYRLRPTGPGNFTIDPITVEINGSPRQTKPITVQVTRGAAPTPTLIPPPDQTTPQPPAPGALSGQDLYAEADVDNPTPVVGQQIAYRFRFYQAVELFDQPRLDWPSFGGFWVKDLSPNNVYQRDAGGRRYRVTEVRRALFPTTAGEVTIPPATLTIPGGFFSQEIVLETEPVVVDVGPLPEGAPEGFAGAVGQFEIEAWVEPQETRVNEPVNLHVRVAGTGNLAALPDPAAEAESLLPDWRVYDPQTTTDVSQEADLIRGAKLFQRLLVPTTPGELHIPSFSLVYFDPTRSEYRAVQTEPLAVRVAPTAGAEPGLPPSNGDKQDVTRLASDIRHIKSAPPTLATQHTPLAERPLYWLGWLLPPLAVAGVWIWERRRRRLSHDVVYARARRAHRLARERLTQARERAQENEEAAYAAVAQALTGYVGDKFDLSAAGLTHDRIRETLAQQDVPPETIERWLACLGWADAGRFAPLAGGRGADEMIAEAKTLLAELEQTLRET